MNPSLASDRGDAGPRLQGCRDQSLFLLGAPAAATLHRGDHFNRSLAHVTIPMNSHMTHTSRKTTRRPLPDGYESNSLRTPSARHSKKDAIEFAKEAIDGLLQS